eukprot:TRINITY_DN7345_c1_g1_i6.p2 TRINITY_DN7345_c1_g1~~TRINITY_DN7345_c1_g1_i6.p2  ORF type:complete len:271 (-),score=41.78 TRINITY_DN7345_c1_g1_i6:388-1101(-)
MSATERNPNQQDTKPVKDCWFCLSNPNVDESLVVSVGSDMYLALDKGPVDNTHVVLVPVEHSPCMLEFSDTCFQEFMKYLDSLRQFFDTQNKDIMCFERFISFKNRGGGNHCTINVIGVDRGQKHVDPRQILMENQVDQEIPAGSTPEQFRNCLRDIVGDMEYFVVWLPDGGGLARPLFQHDRLPLQVGRQVFAEVVGKVDRVDWRKCELQQEEGKMVAMHFQKQFESYDAVMQDQE